MERDALLSLQTLGDAGLNIVYHMHRLAEQCGDTCGFVVKGDCLNQIDVSAFRIPIVRIALGERPYAGLEFLQNEGTSTYALVEILTIRRNAEMYVSQEIGKSAFAPLS
nr:hypothetical protein K4M19_00458 [Agrobacterium fabrum]